MVRETGQVPDDLSGSHLHPPHLGTLPTVLIYVYGTLPGRKAGSLKENQSIGPPKRYACPTGLLRWPLERIGHLCRDTCSHALHAETTLPTYLSSLAVFYIRNWKEGC